MHKAPTPSSTHLAGFSLLELLLVLGVVAVLLLGLFVLLPALKTQREAIALHKGIERMSGVMNDIFPNLPLPTGNVVRDVMGARFPPLDQKGASRVEVYQLRESIGTSYRYGCGGDPRSFQVRYSGMSADTCIQFLSRLVATPGRYCYISIFGGPSTVDLVRNGASPTGTWATPADVAQACLDAETANGVNVRVGVSR